MQSYSLVIKLNEIVLFKKVYENVDQASENIPFVMDKSNVLQLFVKSEAQFNAEVDICLIGKISFVENSKNNMIISQSGEILKIKDLGKTFIKQNYSNVDDALNDCGNNGEAFYKVYDIKEVKCNINGEIKTQVLMLCKSTKGSIFIGFPDGSENELYKVDFDDGVIVPINHVMCPMLVIGVLDGKIKVVYLGSNFDVLMTEDLNIANIGSVKKVRCAVDYSNSYAKIVLTVIDNYNNCYLVGCFDYAVDCPGFYLNTQPYFVGKFYDVNSYIIGDELIGYYQKSQNVVVRGDSNSFSKVGSTKIKNVSNIFNLNGVEVGLKNFWCEKISG